MIPYWQLAASRALMFCQRYAELADLSSRLQEIRQSLQKHFGFWWLSYCLSSRRASDAMSGASKAPLNPSQLVLRTPLTLALTLDPPKGPRLSCTPPPASAQFAPRRTAASWRICLHETPSPGIPWVKSSTFLSSPTQTSKPCRLSTYRVISSCIVCVCICICIYIYIYIYVLSKHIIAHNVYM